MSKANIRVGDVVSPFFRATGTPVYITPKEVKK